MTIRTKLAGIRAIMKFRNRWALVVSRGLFGEPMNVYRLQDIEFIEDHRLGDANGAREVLTSGMYDAFLALIKAKNVSPWSVADFGASNGGFPFLLHLHGFDIKMLVAVEMNPAVFPRLRFNLEHNRAHFFGGRLQELELHNVAVGGTRRAVQIAVRGGSGGSIFGDSKSRTDRAETLAVEVCLPGDVLRGRVFDLIKMDIEGAEHEIFSSEAGMFVRDCRYLIIEIHSGHGRPRDVVKKLEALGLRLVAPTGEIPDVTSVFCFEGTVS